MSFMISRETENIGTMTEVDSAFQAITSGGDKSFVTEEELLQVREGKRREEGGRERGGECKH